MRIAKYTRWSKQLKFFIGNKEHFIPCPNLRVAEEIARKYNNVLMVV